MAKNHADLRDALFDSSAYLADVLTRCVFIEEQLYRESNAVVPSNAEKSQSLVRAYTAILRYAAEVRRIQQFNTGRDIVESIKAITSQPLTQLKSAIKEEELYLQLWLLLDQHLHRKAEAEAILRQVDELIVAVEEVGKVVAMLNLPSVDGACFNSFEDQHEDECLLGTRTRLLQQIQDWGNSSDTPIFWLIGMAGTGKSTISRTAARLFMANGILGASFFFRRGDGDRGTAAGFFPTIVKQLATHIPQTIPGIQKAIEKDPLIATKSLREQFDKLLLQPLHSMHRPQAATPPVILVDALDECAREEDIEIILELLPKASKVIRFLITARPDSAIRFGFDQFDQNHYQKTILQNIGDDVIKRDITLYLQEEFSKIRRKRQCALPQDWPGEERIEALATMAVPLFIFAATVCRFVADRRFNPEKRLEQFLAEPSGSKLDRTYRPVLNQLFTDNANDMKLLIDEFQKVIGVVILLAAPLSLSALGQLLEIPEEDISNLLDSFHSVLSIPDDPHLPIQTLHLSFHDYLVDEQTRAQEATSQFWVDKEEKHGLIASHCLTLMSYSLRKNICGLSGYGTLREETDHVSVTSFLPDALQYACRYWVYHLTQSSASARTSKQILPFLEKHFLHWLEAMSILGLISEAVIAVTTLLGLPHATPKNAIFVFLSDAKRFILKNAYIARRAPLQLYCSGLTFAPQKSLIRMTFKDDTPFWISRPPSTEENWSPELQTHEGHSHEVNCVRFAPDGRTVVSASDDNTIKLWTTTAGLEQTLDGHQDSVVDFALSPDGKKIVSASRDGTIGLWSSTGTLQKKLDLRDEKMEDVCISHAGSVVPSTYWDREETFWSVVEPDYGIARDERWINSVVFSSNGELIVSGCSDGSIQLWDCNGNLQHSLKGHGDSVKSVAISPDSKLIASGSADYTVKLWSTTGTWKHTIRNETGQVKTVSFSPDGSIIVCTSIYGEAKFWGIEGSLQCALGEMHKRIECVAFSPKDNLVATGFSDGIISLWQTDKWVLNHTLSDKTWASKLAFSPDGQQLVSAHANIAKVWQLSTGTLQSTLEGHSSYIDCVAFSPDGKLIASGSGDGTVRIWDATMVHHQSKPAAHTDDVRRVCFSPNGKQIASSSSDGTVRLWDADTQRLQHILSLAHLEGNGLLLYSPDGALILYIGTSSAIPMIWDTTTGALIHSCPSREFSMGPGRAQFSPDSKIVAYHLPDAFEFRHAVSQELAFSVKVTRNILARATYTFSPCSTFVATYSIFPFQSNQQTWPKPNKEQRTLSDWQSDQGIKIRKATTGAIQSIIRGHADVIWTVKISSDGRLVASTSADWTVKLWHADTGELKHCLQHPTYLLAVAISSDTRILASISSDKAIRLWDIASGTLQHTLPCEEEIDDLSFLEDGSSLITKFGFIDLDASKARGSCVCRRNMVSVEDGEWICFYGEKALWLPHEYRGPIAVRDKRVVIGHTNGALTYMEFDCDAATAAGRCSLA